MKEDTFVPAQEVLTSTVDICRDFLRNVCYRDKRCKYRHLTSEELASFVDTKVDPASKDIIYEFCHDFQNHGCDRPNCRFIHCSEDTESRYQDHGILPIRLKYEFELGVQELFAAPVLDGSASENTRPVCRDYTQRQCRRGKKCRFAHVEKQMDNDDSSSQSPCARQTRNDDPHCEHAIHSGKRLRLLHDDTQSMHPPDALQHVKKENLMLRKEVAELRKQVSGLSATNEVLLEQNAQFRLEKRCLVEQGVPFSQGNKTYEGQSTMAVSVPIAMSLSLPRQTQQQLTNTPQLAGATIINSEPLPAVEAVSQAVGMMTHTPAQAHIQFPQNTARIVTNISQSNTGLVDGLQSLTNHQPSVNQTQGLHAGVPIIPRVSLTGPNFSISQKLPIAQDLVWSIPPAVARSSTSRSILHNTSLVEANMSRQSTITLSQSGVNQNPAPNTLVGQTNCACPVEPDPKPLASMNMAQMTHAALVNSSQDPGSAHAAPSDLSASIAAVAAQVIAAHAQPSSEMGAAQISVPTVPCVTLPPTIVPMTITTSLPVGRMVPSLPLDNSATGLIATQIEAVGGARTTSRTTCLPSDNSITFNTVNGHRVVSSQQQLNAPLNFTISPVPSVPPQQSGLHT